VRSRLDSCSHQRSAAQASLVRSTRPPSPGLDRTHDQRAELASAFQEHGAAIYRYLLRRAGNADRAEDLTQEVFVDVAAYVASRERAHPTPSLLFAVARRRLADEIRSAALRTSATPPGEPVLRAREAASAATGLAESLADAIRGSGLKDRLTRGVPME